MDAAHWYYSDRLRNKLKLILFKALTVVEAPPGYGKTSAVREALRAVSPTLVHWATMIDESFALSYKRFLSTLKNIDYLSSKALENLGYPNRSNEKEVAALLRGLNTLNEAWLIVDDLQFLQRDLPPEVLQALTEIRCEKLKVVLISYDMSSQLPNLKKQSRINFIGVGDLKLTTAEIAEYFAHAGTTLSHRSAQSLFAKTEGCLLAVALYLQNMHESDQVIPGANISDLMSEAFWSKLKERERRLIWPFAVFNSLSSAQLAEISEHENSGPDILLITQKTQLIKFDNSDQTYYAHPLLSEFLRTQLDQVGEEQQKVMYQSFGTLLLKQSRPLEALSCFYKIKDYASILASPLELLEYETIDGRAFDDLAYEVLTECPPTIKAEYPLSLLKLAYYLFNALRFDDFERTLNELHELIWTLNDPDLKGEWYLLAALQDLPKLDAMYEKYLKAEQLLTRPSKLFTRRMPYMFGHASLWLLLYSEAGQGDAIGEQFTRLLKLYTKLTNGHGRGADLIYKSELAAVRCEFQEAEILAYEATVIAQEFDQVSVAYGAALILGRIAISKSDMQALEQAIDYLESIGTSFEYMHGTLTNQILLESIRSMLLSILGRTTQMPNWTKLIKDKNLRRGIATFPFSFISGVDLLLHGEFTRAIGLLGAMEREETFLITTALRYYIYIGTCLAYSGLGQLESALHKLEQALTLSEADVLLGSFVQYRRFLVPLLKILKTRKKHEAIIERILQVGSAFADEKPAISAVVAAQALPSSLSAREIEIAELVAQGLRNREVADKLMISEWTVKNHVKNIYKKLSIDRRSELISLLN